MALAGYNLVSLGLLLFGVVLPRARISKRSVVAVFRSYAFENRRRFGSMVVHLGVTVIAVAVMASSAYRVDEQLRLEFGAEVPFQGYELRAVDRFMEESPQGVSAGVEIVVERAGRTLTELRPRLNLFGQNPQLIPTPAVLYRPQHDLYLSIAGRLDPEAEFVVIRAVQSPLITWIWVGGLIVILGTSYALSPGGRQLRERQRQGAVRA